MSTYPSAATTVARRFSCGGAPTCVDAMVALPLASTARCGGPKAAVAFFGGPSPSAEAWAGGLEQRDGGWWPRFDADVMARTLREATGRSYGDEWERISCPVLVVRAGRGQLSAADAQAMVAHGQRVELFELPQAGHDLHLDSPEGWRAAVSRFLGVLDPA